MKDKTPETLESALKDMIRHIRVISDLETLLDENWGVRAYVFNIYNGRDHKGDVTVKRGIEEIEKALGHTAEKKMGWSSAYLEMRHNGVKFTQFADEKTKVFVKAGKEPPKVRIVDDETGNDVEGWQ